MLILNPRAAISMATMLCVATAIGATPRQSPARGTPVVIEFRAITEDGQPVLDLRPADVALKIDGRSREVTSLRLVESRAGGAAPARPALPPPFASNVAAEGGRDVLLVIDDESIAPGMEVPIRETLGLLIAALGGRDRVGLTAARPGGVSIGLTTDHAKVTAALAALTGQGRAESAAEVTCRTKTTLQSLKTIISASQSESPTTLVFVSSGLAAPDTGTRNRLGSDSGLCLLNTTDFSELAAAYNASHANLYVVHAVDGGSSDATVGLEHLSGVTGGEIIRLSGNTEPVMARLARETSAYYLAGLQPDPGDRSGTNHKVEVRVGRDRVKVRAHPDLVIAKAEAAVTPRDMLRSAKVQRELPLRAVAYPSRNGADEKAVKVIALFEPQDASTLGAAMVGVYDEKGKLTAQWTAQPAELTRTPVAAALIVPPGTYRLRVAATDASGRAGTTDYDLRAQLQPAAALRFSAMMLGAAQGGAFAPKLQFTTDPSAVGFLEIYGVPKGANLAVQLELGAAEQGPAIGTSPASVIQGPAEDVRIAFGGFSIATLAPGDYVMRAIVSLDGHEVGRVARTLRKATP